MRRYADTITRRSPPRNWQSVFGRACLRLPFRRWYGPRRAQAFLNTARDAAQALDPTGQVTLYSAVPMSVQRVANVERAQLLIECSARPALQRFLTAWQPVLHGLRTPGLLRWAVDVDPLAV